MCINESFNNAFDTMNDAISYINSCRLNKKKGVLDGVATTFIKYLYDELWVSVGGDWKYTPLRCDEKGEIKISSYYKPMWEDIKSDLTKKGIVDGENIKYNPKNKEKIMVGNLEFKWGEGSIKNKKDDNTTSSSIETSTQEQISVQVFNRYWKFGKEIDVVTIKDENNEWMKDEEYKKFFEKPEYKYWVNSWVQQFNTIQKFLSSKGWGKNLTAVMYGDEDNEISELFEKLTNEIKKELNNINNRNEFNPTDIIIYDSNQKSEIITTFNGLINDVDKKDDGQTIFKSTVSVLSEYYKNNVFVGVSLKKGTSFKPHMLNVEPIKGFENAELQQLEYNPCDWFFKKMFGPNYKKELYKLSPNDIKKVYNKEKTTKTLELIINTDGGDSGNRIEGICLSYRTHAGGWGKSLDLEARLPKSSAQIGRCPAPKYIKYLGQFYKQYEMLRKIKVKKIEYDIKDLCEKWRELTQQWGYIKTNNTPQDIEMLFNLLIPIEYLLNGELYSYYMQIHFLYALYKSDIDVNNAPIEGLDKTGIGRTLRKMLLWSEKLDEDCLPYLLIGPKA